MERTPTAAATLPQRRPLASLVAAVLVCELVGAVGGLATASSLRTWYPSLVRPAVTPPGWVFGPVWTALYATLGVAAWLVWRADPPARVGRVAAGAFAVQLLLNLAWSLAFFGLRSPTAGLVVIAALWLAIFATVWAIDRVDRRAAVLLVPYLAWVTFAAFLNYRFWQLN